MDKQIANPKYTYDLVENANLIQMRFLATSAKVEFES